MIPFKIEDHSKYDHHVFILKYFHSLFLIKNTRKKSMEKSEDIAREYMMLM
jgi:hypothetical protein